jgi:hypothetical protein
MTTDQRLANAREYLGYARQVKVADLPHSALMRMAAELRRQLGQVLDVVTEGEAVTEPAVDEEVWQALLTEVSEMRGYVAEIIYRKLGPGWYRWRCHHTHRTEAAAFDCAGREVRRRFAPPPPRSGARATQITAFNVSTQPVLRETS